MKKICSTCLCEKEFQEFYAHQRTCKSCYNKKTVLRQKANPNRNKYQRDWCKRNPEKMGRVRYKRHGITKEIFQKQLARQNFCCLGCLSLLTEKTADIDHCHKTNTFRGLLCHACNVTLGFAKDSPGTLRRLQAYLDYRIDKTNIYLIGALKNKRIPEIGNLLRGKGYDVMDEWFTPGEHADTNWQEYEKKRGRTYKEALQGRAAQNIFLFDRSYIDHSDIAVLVTPCGKSGMLEIGYARGREKHTIIFLDGAEPDRYDIMPNLVDVVCKTENELLEELKRYDTFSKHAS